MSKIILTTDHDMFYIVYQYVHDKFCEDISDEYTKMSDFAKIKLNIDFTALKYFDHVVRTIELEEDLFGFIILQHG